MAVKSKKSVSNDNILYIQDSEAQALGIFEGSAQKIFINNKEVDVVFVDEHEVIPATAEERKLYQDASKIAAKYDSIYGNEGNAMSRVIANPDAAPNYKVKEGFFSGIAKLFGKGKPTKFNEIEREEFLEELETNEVYTKKHAHVPSLSGDVFNLKNESFSVEELDIIKEIIHTSNAKTSKSSSKELIPSTGGKKASASKSTTAKKPAAKTSADKK
ncbi:MAG: hypothetical protein ACRC4L_00560 [Mycoplasma sp.]